MTALSLPLPPLFYSDYKSYAIVDFLKKYLTVDPLQPSHHPEATTMNSYFLSYQ